MPENIYADLPRYLANYYLAENLGSGYSGSIYRAHHLHTGKVVALKVQRVDHECPTNRYERRFYPLLQGGKGMPVLWSAGVEGKWDYLAIDLLGPSLDQLYRRSGNQIMDLRSVCCIAMQVISRLEFMHSRGILHRDIQLGNCVVGLPPNDRIIYMIDFGFSKQYIDPQTRRHIPDSKAKRDFIGNYWFSSVSVHCRGKVPSRRDDLEAAALMFIHLLTPRGLPWTRRGVPKTDGDHEVLKRAKRSARPEDLCRDMPVVFEEFLRYCRSLKFMDCPDYARWINEFRELASESGFPESDEFIWPPPVPQPLPTPPPSYSPIRVPRQAPKQRTMLAQEVENILKDLENLQIQKQQPPALKDNRPAMGAMNQRAAQNVRTIDDSRNYPPMNPQKKFAEVIEISSDSEGESPAPGHLYSKAHHLNKLVQKVGSAIDNNRLADIVFEFVRVLKGYNSSRTLTKEGFAFLDALHKQLADPSVFIVPMRSRTSNSGLPINEKQPPHVKLNVVARLKREVDSASGSRALAKMVSDFGAVTNRSTGRTVTKDGFAFLEGLAIRLRALG